MSNDPARLIEELRGDAAVPSKNGELVFDAPWQARAFGLAVALDERGCYAWAEFRERLQTEPGAGESGPAAEYYEQWLACLEAVLVEKGVLDRSEIEARTAQLATGEQEEAD